MKKRKKKFADRSALAWRYFLLTLPLSWLFWISAALLPPATPEWLVTALHFLGGLMPMAGALWLVYRKYDRSDRSDFWRRATDFKLINRQDTFMIIAFAPIVLAVAGLFDRATGGDGLIFNLVSPFGTGTLSLISYALFLLAFGPIPEELGWRGFAQDRLQDRYQPLLAGLIVGIIWMLWHLPLFFIEGSYQQGLGVGTLSFWLFLLVIIPQSVLIAWVFSRNHNSTLSAILFHYSINLSGEMFSLGQNGEIATVMLWWIAAIGIALSWRSGIQAREKR